MSVSFPVSSIFILVVVECLTGVAGRGRAPRTGETPSVALLALLPLSLALLVLPPTGPLRDGPGHFVPHPCHDIFLWRGAPSRSARSPPPRGGSGGRGVTRWYQSSSEE